LRIGSRLKFLSFFFFFFFKFFLILSTYRYISIIEYKEEKGKREIKIKRDKDEEENKSCAYGLSDYMYVCLMVFENNNEKVVKKILNMKLCEMGRRMKVV
jgi:hypothetical protein